MERIYRASLLALYQLTLLVGIALLPFAVVARQVGVTLPVHRVVTHLGEKYERATSS